MAMQKVLVPSNLTGNDDKSLEFVVQRFVQEEDVEVTLFNAYNPVPEIEVRNNPIMEKMSRNLSYRRQLLADQEKELDQARMKLIQKGFSKDKVNCIFTAVKTDVAQDIISLVRKNNYSTVVLNKDPAKITRFFTKSISKKVTATLGKDITVFVVS